MHIQANQHCHLNHPRFHTTSTVSTFQIVITLWVLGTPEYLAQIISRLLLEPAQSFLLCLLLAMPLLLIHLGHSECVLKTGLLAGVWMELSQLAGVRRCDGTITEVCTRLDLGRVRLHLRLTISMSAHLIQNSKESENLNLNMGSQAIKKVSFSGRLIELLLFNNLLFDLQLLNICRNDMWVFICTFTPFSDKHQRWGLPISNLMLEKYYTNFTCMFGLLPPEGNSNLPCTPPNAKQGVDFPPISQA